MDTPTSPAPASPSSLSLESCLLQLASGTFSYNQLAAFSDLCREGLKKVEAVWPEIDDATRRRLIAEAVELGAANVLYQFRRLHRLALHDPFAEIRQLAISGLWEDDSASLLVELLEIAREDESEDVRAAAVARLGDSLEELQDLDESPEYVERIAEFVTDLARDRSQAAIIQRRAIEAVGAVRQSPETRELIQDAWEHGDQSVEAGALIAMGRTYESRWRPVVRTALTSEDPELRFAAARALGGVGTSDDVPELAGLARDEDAEVRQSAITSLGEIGGQGAIRVLRNLADESDEPDRTAIEEALDYALLGVEPFRVAT
jgi:HEAT repeat protein